MQTPAIIYDCESPAARQYLQLATEVNDKLFTAPEREKAASYS